MLFVDWLIGTATTICLISLLVGLATRRVSLRDERGRPKPLLAALLAVALLVLIGVLGTAIFE